MFRLATDKDINNIVILLNQAKRRMKCDGLEQWADEDGYPNADVVTQDILKQEMYVIEVDNKIAGVCVINDDFYEAYPVDIDKSKARTIHRVAVSDDFLNRGVGSKLFNESISKIKEMGYELAVVDTYSKNTKMCNLIKKCGFNITGEFVLFDDLPNWIMFAREVQ